MVKIALDGFGRIGQCFTRAVFEHYGDIFKIVGVKVRPGDIDDRAFDLERDEVYGPWHGRWDDYHVKGMKEGLLVNETLIPFFYDEIPWKKLDVDILIVCRREIKDIKQLRIIAARAKKTIITKPLEGVDGTFVFGVNHDGVEGYNPFYHRIISGASCTTSCAAVVLHPILKSFGPLRCEGITVHAITSSQEVMETINQVKPHSTGASETIERVLPALKGKTRFSSIRSPHTTASYLQLTCYFENERPTIEHIKEIFENAAKSYLKGVLEVIARPPKKDSAGRHKNNRYTAVINTNLIKPVFDDAYEIPVWYDNEAGYTEGNLIRLTQHIAQRELWIQTQHNTHVAEITEGVPADKTYLYNGSRLDG